MQTPPAKPPTVSPNLVPQDSRTAARAVARLLKHSVAVVVALSCSLSVLLFARARLGRKTVDTSGLAGERTFASRANSQSAVPSQDQLRQLAKDTLLKFSSAVQKNDFSAFHSTVATQFAQEFSPEQMRQAFTSFTNQKTNLAAIENASAVLQPGPSINERGVLNLAGFFPVQPQPVYFKNRYVWQDAQWKLAAIDVQLGAPIS
jgi:hypothetical protein